MGRRVAVHETPPRIKHDVDSTRRDPRLPRPGYDTVNDFRHVQRGQPVESLGQGSGKSGGHMLDDEDRPGKIRGQAAQYRTKRTRSTRRTPYDDGCGSDTPPPGR